MVGDKDAGHIGQITLSYTFFPVEHPKAATAKAAKAVAAPGLPQGEARKGS